MQPEKETRLVDRALAAVLNGQTLDEATLYELTDIETPSGIEALLNGAQQITERFSPRKFDTCSIVNARSGKCSENCKWCAQSAHFHTGCNTYDIVSTDEALHVARYNAERGIGRFSLVASGRAVSGKALDEMCQILHTARQQDGISTCASMGLLSPENLQKLWDSGVHRYHCNLETAPSYFPTLCSTHTIADKLATIRAAKAIGFEICSGGIIGMGETRRQRMELAIALRQIEPASIPINILCPIKGTPLQHAEPISEQEILITCALFRFAHPRTQLRFAGGRARLSRQAALRAMKIAINSAVVGDLLTTIGSTIAEDQQLITEAGYKF